MLNQVVSSYLRKCITRGSTNCSVQVQFTIKHDRMSQGGVQNWLNLLEILRIFVAAARYYMQPRARASRNIGGGTLGTFDFCVQFIVWPNKAELGRKHM